MDSINQLELDYFNPIKKAEDILKIKPMPLNQTRLSNLKNWKTDEDIETILGNILRDIDLSKKIDGLLTCHINTPRYESALSEYIFYVKQFNNHLKWNEWIDKLLLFHACNLVYEKDYIPPVQPKQKKPKNKNSKPKPKNEFYRRQTFDLFTGAPIYEYVNPRTGEMITSDNPNLATKLNAEIIAEKERKLREKSASTNKERKEREKINRSPDFSKLKFKF